MSKVIDVVGMSILLKKLEHIRTRDIIYEWFMSFLNFRTSLLVKIIQYLMLVVVLLQFLKARSYIPLFISIYIILTKLCCHFLDCVHNAENTTLYLSGDSLDVLYFMNVPLENIYHYVTVNKFSIDLDKRLYKFYTSSPQNVPNKLKFETIPM